MQSYQFLKAWRERARHWQAQAVAPAPPADPAAIEGALLAGEPLMSLVPFTLPAEPFAAALTELAVLLAQPQYKGDRADALALAAALRTATPAEKEALATAVTRGDGGLAWAAAHQVDHELLATLLALAVQPFLARYAAAVTVGAPLTMWRRTYCPVCGTPADVCRIDPDNLRFLHCPQCDTQWEHHRLTCANCDTDDVKRVGLLTLDELEPWRVEVCDVCGGYTKTLDQRHGGHLAMPKVDLFLEDARTIKLNLLAEAEGYRRGGRPQ